MNILVLNAGSGSQKISLFRLENRLPDEPPDPIWEAEIQATAPGLKPGRLSLATRLHGRECRNTLSARLSRTARIRLLLRMMPEKPEGLAAVGHRVVHGASDFQQAVFIDKAVERSIERCAAFAPLHNAGNLEGIRVAAEMLRAPQIAVFDTSFHRTLSEAATTYSGPYGWLDRGIRRYGFHGTSFRWACARAARLLDRANDPDLRLILCHLGGGCSLAATLGGASMDTTMGFTPLDGIAMCTRSGAVDPGILIYLLRQGTSADELDRLLNQKSGLKGLSGMAGDTRVILPEAQKGHARARLAMEVFIHRLRAGIGQMLPVLAGRPDAIVFTDGIGEDEPSVRAAACAPFAFLGLELDSDLNNASPMDSDVAAPGSAVRALIVKSRENWQIARECHELIAESHNRAASLSKRPPARGSRRAPRRHCAPG